jgi:hypothetical protein
MALVGGIESYGMRIQLKFRDVTSLNPILDLQVGKASGKDASYTMSTLERLILEEVLRINRNFQPLCLKVRDVCRLLQSVCWIDKTCRWQSGNYTWDGIAKLQNGLTFPLAEVNLTFTASKHIDFTIGVWKNFGGMDVVGKWWC